MTTQTGRELADRLSAWARGMSGGALRDDLVAAADSIRALASSLPAPTASPLPPDLRDARERAIHVVARERNLHPDADDAAIAVAVANALDAAGLLVSSLPVPEGETDAAVAALGGGQGEEGGD